MARTHNAAIRIEETSASTHLGQRWISSRQRLVRVLRDRFHDQACTPLSGSGTETFYGRFGQLHLDGADGLDPARPLLLLRLPGTLAGGLAAQLYSTLIEPGDRQQFLRHLEQGFISVRTIVRAGSLSACLGAVRDDRNLKPACLRAGFILVTAYLRDRRIWQLAVVQTLSVMLIGFRMSYLLVVQVCTVLLPAIAFAPCALSSFRNRSRA